MPYTNSPECFVFNDKGSNDLATAALMNGGGGNWNNPIWALVFLAFLGRNGGFFGGGNNSQLSQIQDTLNTNQGNTLLMDAIKGNATAIGQLANTIGCNHNAVTSAINGVQSAICSVGNQVGMGTAQVINSIQNGNMSLANTLQSCCCDVKQLVTTQGYENRINNLQQSQLIQNGFSQLGYAAADNTDKVIAKLDQIEDSRKDREIAALTAQLTAATSRAERAAELAPSIRLWPTFSASSPMW